MACPVQTVQLFCTNTKTVSKWIKMRFHTTHITYEFQRVHPKQIMSLLYVQCKLCTYLASRLALSPNGPNRAPPDPRYEGEPSGASKTILWAYVWRKPRTYLAPMLTLSPKRSKRESTWPKSPGSSISCHQYYFWAYSPFDANHPPILHQCSTISKRTEPSFHLSLFTYESHRVRPK
jgi:hypothetical protein